MAGASTALSSSSLPLFAHLPHTPLYETFHGLVVGIPLGITILLFARLKRRGFCSEQENT